MITKLTVIRFIWKWWEKNIHLFDDVVASFHVEHANKEKYEENSIYLCDKLNYHSTKMLLHEERFWEVVSFGNHLKTVMPNYFIEWHYCSALNSLIDGISQIALLSTICKNNGNFLDFESSGTAESINLRSLI